MAPGGEVRPARRYLQIVATKALGA